ncbi:hypothetical protein BCV69DRAFT_283938 [Microstroma glucosiphilum]|uniref:5'-deoxynucleotidase n=1 Tax=Pseudomicrostroma glucosiphilum TaxID=1684307 RepID=A0A316U3F5_9BASI|nr:hypothetical protein BCV69DRAFT_283938 [Pseudomicrostroma glucosiphilum]PWN19832.1 hypothetical protein BCV69DRAFT_283938 [Pseudomicrostroma glucosiphilum]
MAPALDLSSSSSTASIRTALDEGIRQEQDQSEEAACPCLNVRVKYHAGSEEGGKVRLAEEDGVVVALPSLVGKELAQVSALGASSLPRTALRCLHCSTSVYAVEKALSAGPTRSVGFRSASGSGNAPSVTSSPSAELRKATPSTKDVLVRPQDGFIYLLPGSIGADEIREAEVDDAFSPIYGVSVSLVSPPGSSAMLSESSSSGRPSFAKAQHRQSSYGQYTSASQYGLQGLPNHIVISPSASPRARSPSNSMSASVSGGWIPPTGSSSSSSPTPSPLATQLDTAALDSLRQWRTAAEQEIVQMVRAKRREFDDLIKRAKVEGEAMLERVKTAPAPSPATALMTAPSSVETRGRSNGRSKDGRSRDSSLAAPERSADDRSSSEAAIAANKASQEASREASREPSREASPTLSDEAFQRRPTQLSSRHAIFNNGGAGAHISSSLSALSASFAMRGREAPSAMDDWAQKRRLKERYPEGDHSVMTSAATSAANSYSDQGHLATREEVEEEERRGRGRERGPRTDSPAKAGSTAEAGLGSTPVQNIGSAMVAPGTVSRPTMAPSSLSVKHFTKRPAVISVDTGASADADTPRPGGPLGGLASPSADIHLRPRNPPPRGAEALKPATRKSREAQPKGGSKERAERKAGAGAGEKKVAFAETTDQAASRNYSDSEEEEEKELVDERGTAVFDIDEELDGEDEAKTKEGSRTDAVKGAAETLLEQESQSESTMLDGPEEGTDLDGSDEDGRSDLDEDDLGGMRASVGARQAGSFAALAEFGRTRGRGRSSASGASHAAAFDPASIRLDGRVVVPGDSSPKKRSDSRSREESHDVPLVLPSSDYDGNSTSDKRRGSEWDRRKTAIGYRSTIGDAELRLSGLLAPHAPSHRRLWIKERRKNDEKYISATDELEEKGASGSSSDGEDKDKQWFAWQQRAKQIEDEAAKRHRDLVSNTGAAGLLASSMPADRGSGAVGSVGIPMSRQGTSGTTGAGSTTVYDATSGFDREPKTSLPYQERQMVPSLRKATRLHPSTSGALLSRRSSQLPTIPDAEVGESSTRPAATFQPSRPLPTSRVSGTGSRVASPESTSRGTGSAAGALPGSVVTKGFGPGSSISPAGQVTSQPQVVAPQPVVSNKDHRGIGLGLGLGPGVGSAAQSPLLGVDSGTATGHSTPGSRSPGGSVRRSPRPPYIPPPPPTSASIVLQPDPLMKPSPLNLFKTAPDMRFAYNEEGEEEETDWTKVLSFMHRVEQLKTNKRTGWIHHRVPLVESIADHMYRMAILAMLCPNGNNIDLAKCVMLALVHDLAEAEVGDLTPLDGVSKEEKTRREGEALAYLVHDLLGSSPAGLRIESLWHEYEDRQTPESLLVKDLDRFELLLQAVEYEGRYDIVDLQPFFSCAGDIGHPRIRKWAVELAREREEMWRKKGPQWAYTQTVQGSVTGQDVEGEEGGGEKEKGGEAKVEVGKRD